MKASAVVSIFPLPRFRPAAVFFIACGVFTFQGVAGTVIVGLGGTKNFFPFGLKDDGTAYYNGEYQQIYDADRFPGASLITQIGFTASSGLSAVNVTYNLSVGLGVTERTSDSPGSDFASGFTPVFSGSTVAHITMPSDDFDFLLPLTTPFLYDPALGNLLLDINVFSATGPANLLPRLTFRVDDQQGSMSLVFLSNGSVSAEAHNGLITQFTVNPVPEPTTAGMLLLGAALCVPRRVHAPFRSF
jgi:hypothetical protein